MSNTTALNFSQHNQSEIAQQIRFAQDRALSITPLSTTYPDLDLQSAYQIADLCHQAKLGVGATRVGRKIGFTNASIWPTYNVKEPVWGSMYAHTVTELQSNAALCSIAHLSEPRIEPEIIFKLKSVPTVNASELELLACIDWMAHGFEIVQSNFKDWKFKVQDTIAQGGLHGMLLIGPRVKVTSATNQLIQQLEQFTINLNCDQVVIDTGKGSNVLGSPLLALRHFVNLLSQQKQALKADEIITTGTLTGAFPIKAGQCWNTKLSGIDLPGMDVTFIA
jgi:2-keto-4-pentenoate hydratase